MKEHERCERSVLVIFYWYIYEKKEQVVCFQKIFVVIFYHYI